MGLNSYINSLTEKDLTYLKEALIESETKLLSHQLGKQKVNIIKFRIAKGNYKESDIQEETED